MSCRSFVSPSMLSRSSGVNTSTARSKGCDRVDPDVLYEDDILPRDQPRLPWSYLNELKATIIAGCSGTSWVNGARPSLVCGNSPVVGLFLKGSGTGQSPGEVQIYGRNGGIRGYAVHVGTWASNSGQGQIQCSSDSSSALQVSEQALRCVGSTDDQERIPKHKTSTDISRPELCRF